jgi:hypothetical protein
MSIKGRPQGMTHWLKAFALPLVALATLSESGLATNHQRANKSPLLASKDSDIVDFNTQNHKYHDPTCIWAIRCTVHCIKISRAEAQKRGGIPCKVCGGGE